MDHFSKHTSWLLFGQIGSENIIVCFVFIGSHPIFRRNSMAHREMQKETAYSPVVFVFTWTVVNWAPVLGLQVMQELGRCPRWPLSRTESLRTSCPHVSHKDGHVFRPQTKPTASQPQTLGIRLPSLRPKTTGAVGLGSSASAGSCPAW